MLSNKALPGVPSGFGVPEPLRALPEPFSSPRELQAAGIPFRGELYLLERAGDGSRAGIRRGEGGWEGKRRSSAVIRCKQE